MNFIMPRKFRLPTRFSATPITSLSLVNPFASESQELRVVSITLGRSLIDFTSLLASSLFVCQKCAQKFSPVTSHSPLTSISPGGRFLGLCSSTTTDSRTPAVSLY